MDLQLARDKYNAVKMGIGLKKDFQLAVDAAASLQRQSAHCHFAAGVFARGAGPAMRTLRCACDHCGKVLYLTSSNWGIVQNTSGMGRQELNFKAEEKGRLEAECADLREKFEILQQSWSEFGLQAEDGHVDRCQKPEKTSVTGKEEMGKEKANNSMVAKQATTRIPGLDIKAGTSRHGIRKSRRSKISDSMGQAGMTASARDLQACQKGEVCYDVDGGLESSQLQTDEIPATTAPKNVPAVWQADPESNGKENVPTGAQSSHLRAGAGSANLAPENYTELLQADPECNGEVIAQTTTVSSQLHASANGDAASPDFMTEMFIADPVSEGEVMAPARSGSSQSQAEGVDFHMEPESTGDIVPAELVCGAEENPSQMALGQLEVETTELETTCEPGNRSEGLEMHGDTPTFGEAPVSGEADGVTVWDEAPSSEPTCQAPPRQSSAGPKKHKGKASKSKASLPKHDEHDKHEVDRASRAGVVQPSQDKKNGSKKCKSKSKSRDASDPAKGSTQHDQSTSPHKGEDPQPDAAQQKSRSFAVIAWLVLVVMVFLLVICSRLI